MSGSKPTVLLEHYLKQLKLPTMLREHSKLASLCQSERADYQTFLLRLCEREVHDRELRAAERRVKTAKFPVVKTLDTFDFQAQPSINQELVRELIRGEYMDRCENVLLIGNSGTGKSHLATGLAFAACQQGRRVRFFTATGLVTQLLEKREDRQLERFQKQLERLHLIVLDELGYVPFSKAGAEQAPNSRCSRSGPATANSRWWTPCDRHQRVPLEETETRPGLLGAVRPSCPSDPADAAYDPRHTAPRACG